MSHYLKLQRRYGYYFNVCAALLQKKLGIVCVLLCNGSNAKYETLSEVVIVNLTILFVVAGI